MQDSHIEVIGNLVADPTLRVVGSSAAAVANFRIASTPRWRDRETGQWRDGVTTFYNVSAWRGLAENVGASLHRGDRVLVVGRIRERAYVTSAGVERTSLDVDADVVAPDLNRHTAVLAKPNRAESSVSVPATDEHLGEPAPSGDKRAA